MGERWAKTSTWDKVHPREASWEEAEANYRLLRWELTPVMGEMRHLSHPVSQPLCPPLPHLPACWPLAHTRAKRQEATALEGISQRSSRKGSDKGDFNSIDKMSLCTWTELQVFVISIFLWASQKMGWAIGSSPKVDQVALFVVKFTAVRTSVLTPVKASTWSESQTWTTML